MFTGYYSLEVVLLPGVAVAEERDGVGHHPDVAAPAVIIRLMPLSILVAHRQDVLLLDHHRARVQDALVEP